MSSSLIQEHDNVKIQQDSNGTEDNHPKDLGEEKVCFSLWKEFAKKFCSGTVSLVILYKESE